MPELAVAARELGLTPYLVLRSDPEDLDNPEKLSCLANQLVDRMLGSNIVLVPQGGYLERLKPAMDTLIEELKTKHDKKTFLVPVGGSNYVGVWGYIEAFNELLQQNLVENFDDIVFACGSGGTASGLAIANYVCGSPVRIHGVSVSDSQKYFHDHLDKMLQECGLYETGVRASDILDIVDGYKGLGYGLSTDEELELMASISQTSGIIVDPVYSGKAVFGMVSEMKNNPNRFKGKRILFIHTGGLLGLFDNRMDSVLSKSASKVVAWKDGRTQDRQLPA